jgi:hypothetical protein
MRIGRVFFPSRQSLTVRVSNTYRDNVKPGEMGIDVGEDQLAWCTTAMTHRDNHSTGVMRQR